MSGKARMPKALKEARGTLDMRYAVENEMDGGKVSQLPAPEHYDTARQKLWNKYTSILAENGILSEMDSEMLVMLVDSVDTYNTARKVFLEEIKEIKGELAKNAMLSYKIMNESLDRAYRLGQLFGITPFARAKINVPKKETQTTDELFKEIN